MLIKNYRMLFIVLVRFLITSLNAAQPELVSNFKLVDNELSVQIYSNSHLNTIMMTHPLTIRYQITYKLGKSEVVRTLKSHDSDKKSYKFLAGYVTFPPLKVDMPIPNKCAEIKIKFPNSTEKIESFRILSWRFVVVASVFDSADSYDKIFNKNEWVATEVILREKLLQGDK